MKDFFYKNNDIIVVLIILIVLALFAPLLSKTISSSYQKKHGKIDAAEDD